MIKPERKRMKLLTVSVVLAFAISSSLPAVASDCKTIQKSYEKYSKLGQQELRQALESWSLRKNTFTPNPKYYELQKELKKCQSNPKKYAKQKNNPAYADIMRNADGTPLIGANGKPITCWPLIAAGRLGDGNFVEPKPTLDYQDSYQISQVIIYNNPQCFDPGLVVKVQRWIKRYPSALR